MNAGFWDDLLEFIEDRRVIPIIGPELLQMRIADRQLPLHVWLAGRLAERLAVDPATLPAEPGLNDVICRHLQRGGRREDIYPRLSSIMKNAALQPPESLRQLAGIRDFNLFVTTTFDSLLAQAIDEERVSGGQGKTQSIVFSPSRPDDLSCKASELSAPTVFHLLGRVCSTPDYVISEEDTLEFLHAMQGEKRPKRLFDELKENHLLLIGCSFPDWLARFFIRLTKGTRLSGQRDWQEIVADQATRKDANLVLFLQHFSYPTQIFAEGNATEFVDELARRYAARHPAAEGDAQMPACVLAHATDEMPPGAVFLSYASQDLPAVQRLHAALNAAGVQVWFDKRQLEAGDHYDAKIRRNIRACSLFLPVISVNTQARLEGYFRLEWRLAAERAMQIADSVPFILPISIDGTNEGAALVPDTFLKTQWSHLPAGEVSPDFAARLIRLVRDYHTRTRGPA